MTEIEKLQDQLHGLESRMEALRRRIWAVENDLEKVPDPENVVAALKQEFSAAGDQFTATYRAWSSRHAED